MIDKLSKRLQTIADKLTPASFFADIGSDHAYLPCYVCNKDLDARAIAGEVRQGPYNRALQTVRAYQLTNRIDVRLGDGLEVIKPDEMVEEIVIAGMGGGLITNILQSGLEQLHSVQRLIIQPNTNAIAVRKLFNELHYTLIDEVILEENNQYYEILIAIKNDNESPYHIKEIEKQLLFGPYLLKEKSPTFIKKWQLERNKLEKVIKQLECSKENHQTKISLFQEQIKWIEEVTS